MDLRDWRYKKLSILSQEDTEVWSGSISQAKDIFTPKCIDCDSTAPMFTAYSGMSLACIDIPNGAKRVRLSTNGNGNMSNSARRSGVLETTIYYPKPDGVFVGGNLLNKTTYFTDKTFDLTGDYKYLYVSCMTTKLETSTFEFSKNSGGGTKLLTALLNLVKRGLSR